MKTGRKIFCESLIFDVFRLIITPSSHPFNNLAELKEYHQNLNFNQRFLSFLYIISLSHEEGERGVKTVLVKRSHWRKLLQMANYKRAGQFPRFFRLLTASRVCKTYISFSYLNHVWPW